MGEIESSFGTCFVTTEFGMVLYRIKGLRPREWRRSYLSQGHDTYTKKDIDQTR